MTGEETNKAPSKLEKKLKTLTLILRSLPPKLQSMIVEQLPDPVVERLAETEVTIEDELTEADWEFFYESWPEFASMIDHVQKESANQALESLLVTERSKVREYISYKLGHSQIKPKLTSSMVKIINQNTGK